jgi:hypothetical protein
LGQGKNQLNIVSPPTVCLGNSFLHPCQLSLLFCLQFHLSLLSLLLMCTDGNFQVGLWSGWLTWTQPSYVQLYNLWLYVALNDYYCLLAVLKRHAWSMSKLGVCRNFPTTCPVFVRMSWTKGKYHTCWFKAGWCRSSMESVCFETLPCYSASELWTFMPNLRKC